MNPKRTSLALLATCILMAPFATAQDAPTPKMYRWVGADGKTHYGDVIPPEALTQAHTELSKANGIMLKDVDRAATPEERAAAKAKAEAEAKAEEALEKTRQTDQMLLTSYPTEADLLRAYTDRIAQVYENLKATRMSLDTQQQAMAGMLGAASNMELANKPVPMQLAESIKVIHGQILEQQQAESQEAVQAAGLKQESLKAVGHYRELRTAAEAAATAHSGGEPATPDGTAPSKN